MKDLSAYYEIARLITAELSETITPEEKGRLNVWLAEDERHYMRYCRIRERLKRGEGENVFRNPERVREDMEKLKKKLSGNKRRFLLSGNYFWRYGAVAVFTIGIAIGLIERPWEDRSSEMSPMAQQPAVLPSSLPPSGDAWPAPPWSPRPRLPGQGLPWMLSRKWNPYPHPRTVFHLHPH